MRQDTEHPAPDAPDLQANITAYWNLRGESYDGNTRHGISRADERVHWRPVLKALFPSPADVLDIGTGTGFLAILLAELGQRVTGLDPSEGMLAVARGKANGLATPPVFAVGDGHAPPFPAERFDVVTSRHVLWTLRDPAAAFRGWYQVLRPGGVVLAFDGLWAASDTRRDAGFDGTPWAKAYQDLYDERVRRGLPFMHTDSLEPAVALLAQAGFEDVAIERLSAIEEAERAQIGDPTWQPEPRFVLRGRRPR